MPRNGSGTYSLPKPPFVPATTISSSDVNSDFSDIASALSGSIAADGQTPITSPLEFPAGTAALPSHTFASDPTTGLYLSAAGVLGLAADGVAAATVDGTKVGTGQDGSIFAYGNGAVLSPVGIVQDFAGSTAPSGWLLCFGQAISRTSYPELFTVIATTYGIGDGTTTFNLPDLRGRLTAGKDNMGGTAASRITTAGSSIDGTTLGAAGGAQNGTIAQANLPSVVPTFIGTPLGTHQHTYASAGLAAAGGVAASVPTSSGSGLTITVSAVSAGTPAGTISDINGGVSQTPVVIMPPTMILNKIIFAGRP